MPAASADSSTPAAATDPWSRAKAGSATSSAPNVAPNAAALISTVSMPGVVASPERGCRPCGARRRAAAEVANAIPPTSVSPAVTATAAVVDHSPMTAPATSGPATNATSCSIPISA